MLNIPLYDETKRLAKLKIPEQFRLTFIRDNKKNNILTIIKKIPRKDPRLALKLTNEAINSFQNFRKYSEDCYLKRKQFNIKRFYELYLKTHTYFYVLYFLKSAMKIYAKETGKTETDILKTICYKKYIEEDLLRLKNKLLKLNNKYGSAIPESELIFLGISFGYIDKKHYQQRKFGEIGNWIVNKFYDYKLPKNCRVYHSTNLLEQLLCKLLYFKNFFVINWGVSLTFASFCLQSIARKKGLSWHDLFLLKPSYVLKFKNYSKDRLISLIRCRKA